MPGLNGTGPRGEGPFTGRRMGTCRGDSFYGRGLGRGAGRGIGNRFFRSSYDNYSNEDSLNMEKEALEERLNYIKEEINKFGEK
ncbi:MAG: DUF5320 domain-containing protein [Clostridiaceae bacterium]